MGKCSYVRDAMKACPELVLVNGEDLSEYRRVSQKIFSLLRAETGKGVCPVERLGMDENFVDISALVEEEVYVDHPVGHVYHPCGGIDGKVEPPATVPKRCEVIPNCICFERLKIGSVVAKRIRDKILSEFGITRFGL